MSYCTFVSSRDENKIDRLIDRKDTYNRFVQKNLDRKK